MAQALMERNSELQALRQYLGGKDLMSKALISNQQAEVTSISPHIGEQTDQVRTIDSCRQLCRLHSLSTCKA
jgi:myomegalin